MANEQNQPAIAVPYEVYQRQQLAEELKNAPKLDTVQPGGVYLGTDGQLHDANGKPVKQKSAAGADQQESDTDMLADVELTPAAREKAIAEHLVAEDFKRQRKSGASGFTVEDVERIAERKAKG